MRRIAAILLANAPASSEALARVAEIALGYAPSVGIDLGDPALPLDTVYLDLTGCAHLHGGEEATLSELVSRIVELGQPVRAAIAEGPRIARAIARFAHETVTIVPEGEGREASKKLPLAALPLAEETLAFLDRVGMSTVGDLARLPSSTLTTRLGLRARDVLELMAGRDIAPMKKYEPPRIPVEQIAWENGISLLEPLLFALRGLVARLSARLEGRGEAVRALELRARYDASIAALRGIGEAELVVRIELPAALLREADLFRVLKAKLETIYLEAPVTSLSLAATLVTRAPRVQLDFGRDASASPDALPTLLAELSAELGPSCFGIFSLVATHRPEAKAKLVPPSVSRGSPQLVLDSPNDEHLPTRLLPCPVPISGALSVGELLPVGPCSFTIESLQHQMRLDRVEWWSESPLCRDYACVWLAARRIYVEAWVYRDRATGERYLQGYFD